MHCRKGTSDSCCHNHTSSHWDSRVAVSTRHPSSHSHLREKHQGVSQNLTTGHIYNGGASRGVQIKGWHHTISGICLSCMEIIMFKPQSCVHSVINILLTFSQEALKSSASGRRRAICKDSRWLAINWGLSPGASNSKG